MTSSKVSDCYPRPGEQIAPSTLRDFLQEPIPEQLRERAEDAGMRLCDLDRSAWDRFSPETVVRLSKAVVQRVAACHPRRDFSQRCLPRLAPGTRLEDLTLECRTRRCLAREGFEDDLESLGNRTLGEILAIRAFGPRCLVDLLTALEAMLPVRRDSSVGAAGRERLSEELTAQARRLANLPAAESAVAEDPRFAELIRAVDADSNCAAELARRLLARRADPPDARRLAEKVRLLNERIEGLEPLTLEEELGQIFAPAGHERNRQIVVGYYGWQDGRPHTLTEIGNRFGITRERVRQICAKATRKPRKIDHIFAPVMDRTLELIAEQLPCSAEQLEAELAAQGLTGVGICLENLAFGAELLGRPFPLRIVKMDTGRLAVRPKQLDAAAAAVDLAKKNVYFHGLGTVGSVERTICKRYRGCGGRKLVAEALKLIDGFAWLDRRTGWFRIRSIAKHGLPKTIAKILSVAGEVTVWQMRTALSRNRRMWKDPPPAAVLLEFCRQTPQIRVEGKRIIGDPPPDWKTTLTGVEQQLVGVLKQHGPVMERGAMEDFCVRAGMNRFSFHAFVSWSPVIAQFGHSVYGLLGSKVSKRTVRNLIEKHRARRTDRRVLDSHGRTDDGKVWLSYRLSKAASTYAVITIPAALKTVVRGRFDLLSPQGEKIGTLATKDGRAWGLGAFLRRHGTKIGDHITLTLDLEKRAAVVSLQKDTEPD